MRLIIVLALCLVASVAFATVKVNEVQRQPDGSTITFFNNYHSAIVAGRKLKPLGPKLNPIWWFKNDFEPKAPSWYEPNTKPDWWRQFSWYMRNPWQNAGRWVFGLADRNYRVDSDTDIRVGGDLFGTGRTGCFHLTFSNISGYPRRARRHFVSCTQKNYLWYAGTQWTGFYGFKFNVLNSKVQLF